MTRIATLDRTALDAEGQSVYDEIAAMHTGHVRGPWAVALRIPQVAAHTHALYERLSAHTQLGQRLFELMVLIIARQWSAQFAWHTHVKYARAGGITDEVIDAIAHRRPPPFVADDERLVYDVVTELAQTTELSAATYERAQAYFGDALLVELISGAGLYTMVAMMLKAFDVSVPETAERLP